MFANLAKGFGPKIADSTSDPSGTNH